MASLVGGVIAPSLGTLALGASIALVRSATLKSGQKLVRLAAVWCLPLLGPMVVLDRLQKIEPKTIPREFVAASGLGWGVLGDPQTSRVGSAQHRHGRADETANGRRDSRSSR